MKSADIDFTLADRFHAAEKERGNSSGEPPPRPIPRIRLHPGNLPGALDETETALAKSHGGTIDDIYVYGSKLVQVSWANIRVAGNKTELSLQHQSVNSSNVTERFARAVEYEKWSKGEKRFLVCNPPDELGATYLARPKWNLPTLLGVTTAPTLLADGTVLDTPGYDADSGLIYEPLGVSFPSVPVAPTKADALRALKVLSRPIKLYRFPTPADKAVALSGILTAIIRTAVPNVPMHAVDAPTAGSGKSVLVDVASVIATGHAASVTATGGNAQEFEKRLSSMILAGDPIIAIDNVSETLDSDLLCQMLTQTMVNVRIFGKLEKVPMPSTATVFVTGNNITLAGDLTRRVLICRIDTDSEQPELERYPFHPVALARRSRARYVIAALTLIRAYLLSGERADVSPIGSYQEWSRFVREPLVWLGEVDPVSVISVARKGDPRLQRLVDVVGSWANIIGLNIPVFTREIIATATRRRGADEHGEGDDYEHPFFREAVLGVASTPGGTLSPDRFGWWLRRNRGRPVKIDHSLGEITVRIVQEKQTTQGVKWTLERADAEKPQNVVEEELPF